MQCETGLKIGKIQLDYWEFYISAYGIWTMGKGARGTGIKKVGHRFNFMNVKIKA